VSEQRTEQAELLALAVHEFRTPVTVVGGYLRMLAREQVGPLNEQQRKLLEETERSCSRLGALVGELSELANLDAGSSKFANDAVELPPLLADAASRVHEGRDRGVIVEVVEGQGATLTGDRTRLGAALTALIHAVVREQTEPSRIVVHSSVRIFDRRRWAAVAVGRASEIEKLFGVNANGRLNEFRGGLGLTLPIARRVIETHGGRVWSLGEGRTLGSVAVVLPLREKDL
jgi:signal transduction histidine kinase